MTTVATQFTDQDTLVAALREMGYTHVEIHETPQQLYGYDGKIRSGSLANVVVRRQYVGPASNDLGFVRGQDGTYKAIISQYDSTRHNAEWLGKLKQHYAGTVFKNLQFQKGYYLKSQTPISGGRIRILLTTEG